MGLHSLIVYPPNKYFGIVAAILFCTIRLSKFADWWTCEWHIHIAIYLVSRGNNVANNEMFRICVIVSIWFILFEQASHIHCGKSQHYIVGMIELHQRICWHLATSKHILACDIFVSFCLVLSAFFGFRSMRAKSFPIFCPFRSLTFMSSVVMCDVKCVRIIAVSWRDMCQSICWQAASPSSTAVGYYTHTVLVLAPILHQLTLYTFHFCFFFFFFSFAWLIFEKCVCCLILARRHFAEHRALISYSLKTHASI